MMQNLSRLFTKLHLVGQKSAYVTTTQVLSAAATPPTPRLPPGYIAPAPYALFVKEKFKLESGEKVPDAMRRIAEDWKNLSAQDKNVYLDNSKKIKEQKKAEFDKLSNDEKHDLLAKNVERLAKRKRLIKKRELHKFKAETNKPKQPSTSYMHFVQELYKKADAKPKGVEEISKFGAAAGQKWKTMSAQEKKPYEDKAAASKEEYQKKLAQWKVENADAIEKWEKDHAPVKPKKVKVSSRKKRTGIKKVTAAKKSVAAKKEKGVVAKGATKKKVSSKTVTKKPSQKKAKTE